MMYMIGALAAAQQFQSLFDVFGVRDGTALFNGDLAGGSDLPVHRSD